MLACLPLTVKDEATAAHAESDDDIPLSHLQTKLTSERNTNNSDGHGGKIEWQNQGDCSHRLVALSPVTPQSHQPTQLARKLHKAGYQPVRLQQNGAANSNDSCDSHDDKSPAFLLDRNKSKIAQGTAASLHKGPLDDMSLQTGSCKKRKSNHATDCKLEQVTLPSSSSLAQDQVADRKMILPLTQQSAENHDGHSEQGSSISSSSSDESDGSSSSSSSSESSAEEVIDFNLCMCRIWNKGLGGQCTHERSPGSEYCRFHKGLLLRQAHFPHGRIDGPIPPEKKKEFRRKQAKLKKRLHHLRGSTTTRSTG